MLHVPRCYLLGKLDRMYYGNNKTTARNIGFDDSFIYDEIALKLANRKLPPEILLHNEEIKVFEAWTQKACNCSILLKLNIGMEYIAL